MKRSTCIFSLLLLSFSVWAKTIPVRNARELNDLNATLQPGDTVVLMKRGNWNNAQIKITASGTEKKPIVFRADTPGEVIITGVSQLRLGGNYLVVDGLSFINGHTPGSAVIDFRVNDKQLANHCRVTNCKIEGFNQPKRMDEDYWISFSGQHNRLDHCTFLYKMNLGVLLAVILDDDRSRNNYHEIDHNYFGRRPPLGSNGGEIIRVGVSQHCQYNSNTQIHDNFFQDCDGETEIVSIKSCANVVSNNLFKECQGDVVLRHGNYNTVVNNVFLGNGKEGTGGVRIINKGQWVANNFFYQCRGVSFRSPLSLMNGIPNSPANRYVQVTDAVVANNSFFECSPISFGEGSDAERTLAPANVLFTNNIFDNTRDSAIYHAYDQVNGIRFAKNKVSKTVPQTLTAGFDRAAITTQKTEVVPIPVAKDGNANKWLDSLRSIKGERPFAFSATPGFSNAALINLVVKNSRTCGAAWTSVPANENEVMTAVMEVTSFECTNAEELYKALEHDDSYISITLTGNRYVFNRPLVIHHEISIERLDTVRMSFSSTRDLDALFILRDDGKLDMHSLYASMKDLHVKSLIASDTAGSSEHFNLEMFHCNFKDMEGCGRIFYAHASTIADSIVALNCQFRGMRDGFVLEDEKGDKGYYNVEKMHIENCSFEEGRGRLLSLYRGGNDESTMGPYLVFTRNEIANYNTGNDQPLIYLTGVQKTNITYNKFQDSNTPGDLILYRDNVRAVHLLSNNLLLHSGAIKKDQFVTDSHNQIQ